MSLISRVLKRSKKDGTKKDNKVLFGGSKKSSLESSNEAQSSKSRKKNLQKDDFSSRLPILYLMFGTIFLSLLFYLFGRMGSGSFSISMPDINLSVPSTTYRYEMN